MANSIGYIRKEVLGMTQAQLAEVAGVRQATVSRWESGELVPSIVEVGKIREAVLAAGKKWSDAWVWGGEGKAA